MVHRLAALGLLLLTLFAPGGAAAAAGIDEYRRELRAALADLDQGSDEGIQRAVERVRALRSVTLPDGTTIEPENAAVLRALEARPPDRGAARTYLRSLLVALERGSPGTSGSTADPVQALQRVFDRPEFRPPPPPNPVARFLADLERAIGEWIADLLLALLVRAARPGPLRTALEVAGVLLVVGLVAWVALRFRREFGQGVAALPDEEGSSAPTAERAREEALRLGQRGAFREAIRALYLAVLRRWDEQGLLRFDRAMTNREVLAQARRNADATLVTHLAPLVERFDQFWYGGTPCSEADYAEFSRLVDRAWEGR